MTSHLWTREQTLAALHVYFQLSFGRLHKGQPKIKELAAWIGRTPSSVALKLVNFASLDPQVQASGRKGMGNASFQDKAMWHELQVDWDRVVLEAAAIYESLAQQHDVAPDVDLLDEIVSFEEGRTRTASVQARVNQARFRRAVLTGYDNTCCISGLRNEKLVIASHISPWRDDKKNRLNPQNGLCLSALHDRAYDQGLITVLPDFTLRVSKNLTAAASDQAVVDAFLRFEGKKIKLPERFAPHPFFLESHARRFGFLK